MTCWRLGVCERAEKLGGSWHYIGFGLLSPAMQSWRINVQREGECRGEREAAVSRWRSSVCFEVADCCWEQGRVEGETSHSLGVTTRQHTSVLFACVDSSPVVAVLLSVEALYAAQGQEQPAAASGNCPIWILGPVEGGGKTFLV